MTGHESLMSDRSLRLDGYQDWYCLRSLLLRVAEEGGRFLSATDQADAQEYADRLTALCEPKRNETDLAAAAGDALVLLSSFACSLEREGISSPAMRERVRATAVALRAALGVGDHA